MSKGKILIVDDDLNICELLRLYIEKEDYEVMIANDGLRAIELFTKEHPDLMLLDVMLPRMDGWQVCREIRKTSNKPIIMLSAKGELFDKILGLELGADDYISKPFEAKEVIARIHAVLRRTSTDTAKDDIKEVNYDKLSINLTNYELKVDGKLIDTPPKELELLYYLASHPGKVLTRNELLEKVWEFNYGGECRTVDVHVKRLREKINGVSNQWSLKTVWGKGYKFDVIK
ncbi:MAG: response regulator transcription factor [Ruminococcus sp.]|nr:response regulator transcription factor [Ruminococcus sp.]